MITGIIIRNRYLVICFVAGLKPGAMISTIKPLNMENTTDIIRVTTMARFINKEYTWEYSLSSFKYFAHTGTRNALVAPEKKRVWISSGKLKATTNASTSMVAPKRYACIASLIYPKGLLIIVMRVIIEPFLIISLAGFEDDLSLYVVSFNLFSLDYLTKFIETFLLYLAYPLPCDAK